MPDPNLVAMPICGGPLKPEIADPTSPQFVNQIEQWLLDQSLEALLTHGEVPPVVLLFAHGKPGAPPTEEIWSFTADISGLMGSERNRDVLAHLMPRLAQQFDAFLAVLVTEAYGLVQVGGDYEKARREAYQHGSLADHPDAREVLVLTVHTRSGTHMVTRAIDRDEKGEPTGISVIDAIEREGHRDLTGRMVDWLKPMRHEAN